VFAAQNYPVTIVELKQFSREAGSLWSEQEVERLTVFLALNPEAGDVIPGTGGVRKLRWKCGGRGKRGGARVIYYFRDLNMPLYLVAVYRKGEKDNITEEEKRMAAQLVNVLVAEHSRRWLRTVSGEPA
jgi:hypothetical protein